MYKQSNEIEEVGIVNLNGVNIENNPEMEALLGVTILYLYLMHSLTWVALVETLHLHPLHVLKFLRVVGAEPQGIHILDI